MTSREFLKRITSRELTELEVMEAMDPVTDRAIVMQLARLTAMFFNVHRGDSAPKHDADMIVFDPKPEKTREQKTAEVEAALQMMFGG